MKKQNMKYRTAEELDEMLKPFQKPPEPKPVIRTEFILCPKENLAMKTGKVMGWVFALLAFAGIILLFFLITFALISGLSWLILWLLTSIAGMF